MGTIILGTGILTWHPDERRTDRYGAVHLTRTLDNAAPDPVVFDTAPVGAPGRLVAVIVGTRPAFHLGDLARGIGPDPAAVGDQITLGTGTLFVESSRYGATEIGVAPDDGRDDAWLDPAALYRCHSQTIRLELHQHQSTMDSTRRKEPLR
ncbi:hypothetical protein [Amycolatopsis sp. NPDC058986]|uniref:hypothetical protein n=1 Tax=unclassified Amycolatopsis TaxID=2618356 RepID=UPI00366A7982